MSMSLGPCPSLPSPVTRGPSPVPLPHGHRRDLAARGTRRGVTAGFHSGRVRRGERSSVARSCSAQSPRPAAGVGVVALCPPPSSPSEPGGTLPAKLVPGWMPLCSFMAARVGLRNLSFLCRGLDPAFSQGFTQSPRERPHTLPQTRQDGL